LNKGTNSRSRTVLTDEETAATCLNHLFGQTGDGWVGFA